MKYIEIETAFSDEGNAITTLYGDSIKDIKKVLIPRINEYLDKSGIATFYSFNGVYMYYKHNKTGKEIRLKVWDDTIHTPARESRPQCKKWNKVNLVFSDDKIKVKKITEHTTHRKCFYFLNRKGDSILFHDGRSIFKTTNEFSYIFDAHFRSVKTHFKLKNKNIKRYKNFLLSLIPDEFKK